MTLRTARRLASRYLIPAFLRSVYFSLRYKCMVSLRSDIQLSSRIVIGRGTDIRPFTRIITTDGRVTLGRGVGLNSYVFISTENADVTIGNDVRVGPHTTFLTANRKFDDRSLRIVDQPKVERSIVVEDDAWIGANCVILPGVTIGRGSVVGAGSIVTKSIPPMSVAMGNPARVVRERGRRRRSIAIEALNLPTDRRQGVAV